MEKDKITRQKLDCQAALMKLQIAQMMQEMDDKVREVSGVNLEFQPKPLKENKDFNPNLKVGIMGLAKPAEK